MTKHVYIIAETGCNHNGSLEMAKQMVDAAKAAGVDAVKFHTFSADALISKYAPKAEYQKDTTGVADTQLEMTRKLELSHENFLILRDYTRSLGMDAFSTGFDLGSVDFLIESGQSIWKIPSGELTNLPLLRRVGGVQVEGKRLLLSTGMATIDEIRTCVETLIEAGTPRDCIVLLHCNTEYPTPDEDVNVSAILDIKANFPDLQVGLSDHSLGSIAAVAAVAMGATVIEKHLTLDKSLPGPDHKASATPEELACLCASVRRTEKMYGVGQKIVTDSERKNMIVARKSIVALRAIKAGEVLSEENVTTKRPGNGISPMRWDDVLGKVAPRDFEEDELIEVPGIDWQM